MLDKRGRAKTVRMKTFAFQLMASRCLICFVLALTVITTECLPLFETATAGSTSSSTSSYVEDWLRLHNVSNEDVEASRQRQIALRHSGSVNHRHFPPAVRQQQQDQHLSSLHLHSEAASPASSLDAQIIIQQRNRSNVTVNMSTRSAFQRKQEVIRNVLGFVNENGRPQMPFPSGGLPLGIGPIPPFFPPFSRPEATADLYERTHYVQPSCETPKHADEEVWSAGTTLPLSLHLFFNLSGIQSQTRNGYQLYVTGAKLRLFKFAEGEAILSASLTTESADANPATDSPEPPLQTLKAVPFFDAPLHHSYEEKIRVSVHNFTRALKRNRVQKKKLLDSQMALAKEESYMKLDIKLAARWWLASGGRNFGLTVEVEDTDGQRKPITQFFRPRNCSPDNSGSTRSDELTDPANVASPVLELTLIEMPEGKSVFELPSNAARGRQDEMESTGGEDFDTFTELTDESSSRRHRHQHSAQVVHTSQEEQADEAVHRVNNHSLNNGMPSNPVVTQVGKHRNVHPSTSRLGHSQWSNYRPTIPSPVPTLATLEDHDLSRDNEERDTSRAEIDGARFQLHTTNIFMQRMMQHQQNQQHHFNSKPPHHLRAKDNRKQ